MCAVTKVAKLSSWSLPQTINWHEHVHYKKKISMQSTNRYNIHMLHQQKKNKKKIQNLINSTTK